MLVSLGIPQRFAVALLPAVIACNACTQTSATAQSATQDVQVSEPGVIDPEFDQPSGRFTWVDAQGSVWIGRVDRASGNFIPPSGKAVLVDTGAVPADVVGNGPEWVYGQAGAQIVYTKYDEDGGYALGRARFSGKTWSGDILENGTDRFGPFGSLDRADPAPRISYVGRDLSGRLVSFWRELANPASETVVPGATYPGSRWVPGRRAVVFVQEAGGVRQVFTYDIDRQISEQLTFDPGLKKAPFLWQAPEFGGALVLLALVDETHLGLYRRIQGRWTRFATLKPPSTGDYLWSPEPLVHNGKSYVFMVTSTSSDSQSRTVPTDIWLAGIDPTAPFYRQLSDATARVRTDPEVFVTDNGPYIYFLVFLDPETPAILRTDTGLGPSQ
ncbi:hypothetical protein [Gloeobacter violaceus]|uniref:Glr4234 protein n=1 Tax=Gloeobacter violaceus (strain ATCC 29082 / PCC 7421) TaxID=251221 RepID=Q7NDK1_GLOVI|nr:hypothetical protein [Gloeobacter violaceus]BAC92175.1 glr4234 [Gloeobacter violaceus PCC 7421]